MYKPAIWLRIWVAFDLRRVDKQNLKINGFGASLVSRLCYCSHSVSIFIGFACSYCLRVIWLCFVLSLDYVRCISFHLWRDLYPVFTIKQTSSNHQANVFKTHVHDVYSNCLMFASLCSRGITTFFCKFDRLTTVFLAKWFVCHNRRANDPDTLHTRPADRSTTTRLLWASCAEWRHRSYQYSDDRKAWLSRRAKSETKTVATRARHPL